MECIHTELFLLLFTTLRHFTTLGDIHPFKEMYFPLPLPVAGENTQGATCSSTAISPNVTIHTSMTPHSGVIRGSVSCPRTLQCGDCRGVGLNHQTPDQRSVASRRFHISFSIQHSLIFMEPLVPLMPPSLHVATIAKNLHKVVLLTFWSTSYFLHEQISKAGTDLKAFPDQSTGCCGTILGSS